MSTQNSDARTKLLLVEDAPGDARLLQEMLRGAVQRYHVTVATSLAEASQVGGDADMVLLDLGLPDSVGLETFLSSVRMWRDKPHVVLSGLGDEAVAREAVRAGAQDYIVKGELDAKAVQRAIGYALERHRALGERERLQHELEHSRRLETIGRLAAGVAHEINTPTQYVSDNLRFLEDAVGDLVGVVERIAARASAGHSLASGDLNRLLAEADAEFLVEELPRAVTQSLEGMGSIARIVRAMKEYSHPVSSDRVPTDLNRLVETTVVLSSNEWKYVANVETDLAPDLHQVFCLPGEINQVLLNLVVNAAHAVSDVVQEAEGRGTITIRTRNVGDAWVEVRVEDSGAGIADEHRDSLFDPFFTTKGLGRGTGQGLAIARDVVVNMHRGSITFESEEGEGATFVVRLPLRSETPETEVA